MIGTFPSGNPSCNVPGCTTGGIDRFTSNGIAPFNSSNGFAPNQEITNTDIYPLVNGTFSSATTGTAGDNFTTFLTGGTYNVVAHYPGDGVFGSSTSSIPISVTVNPEASVAETCAIVTNPATNVTTGEVLLAPSSNPPYLCTPATTAAYGEFVTIRADVIGSTSLQESATGVLSLTDNGAAVANPIGGTTSLFTLNTEGYLEDQTTFLAVGTHSFAATYHGDASYNPSATSTLVPFSVTQAATISTVHPSFTTITATQPITVSASVDTSSLGNAPTGMVTFMSGTTSLGTATLSPTVDTNGFVEATATLGNVKPPASGNIIFVYAGDTNYIGSTSPGVFVTVGTGGINLSPATATINISSPGQSATQTFTVTGQNSFAGTVALTAVGNWPIGRG